MMLSAILFKLRGIFVTKTKLTKTDMINTLNLELHPTEGGYFKVIYLSDQYINMGQKQRKILSCINYMLSDDSPCGFMHRNRSDIIHFFHGGNPIKYQVITADGQLIEHVMGPDILNGQVLHLLVKGGDWKISQLLEGDYGLISESVSPGFEYEDNELMTHDMAKAQFADIYPQIKSGIK